MVTLTKTEVLHITPPPSGTDTEKSPVFSVLYVDETMSLVDIVCRYLERGGEMVANASNSVEDAINKMRYISYDVIITDYNFEDGSGNALLKNVRGHSNQTPFVYFLLSRTENLENEARAYGNVTFIEKLKSDPKSWSSTLYQAVKTAALKSSGKNNKMTADAAVPCFRETGA
jgi:DNA-binding NtrC family response regulator